MTHNSPQLTVSVMQAAAVSGSIAPNLETIATAARNAAREHADVLVTPELFVTNYDPESLASWYTPQEYAAARETIAALAAETNVAIVASLPILDAGHTYIGAVFQPPVGPSQVYYKTHLFSEEKQTFTAGDKAPPIFMYRGFHLSMMICFDVEFPEVVRSVAARGAEVLLVPTALMSPFDEPARILIPARAFENHIAIAYANHLGFATPTLHLTGDSVIVGPHGRDLCRAAPAPPAAPATRKASAANPAAPPELITATILREDLMAAKGTFNYLTERRETTYQRWSALTSEAGEPSAPQNVGDPDTDTKEPQ